jgi:hypothetical protein
MRRGLKVSPKVRCRDLLPGYGRRAAPTAQLGDPEGGKRSITELDADEVGTNLKWATAKVERSSQRGNGDRSSGRQRQTERGDFNDPAPTY